MSRSSASSPSGGTVARTRVPVPYECHARRLDGSVGDTRARGPAPIAGATLNKASSGYIT